jgi:hypothetical protein
VRGDDLQVGVDGIEERFDQREDHRVVVDEEYTDRLGVRVGNHGSVVGEGSVVR